MKRFLVAAYILFSNNVFSQTAISGTVTSGKDKPLHGVSIAIENSYDGATTDSTGRFSFTSSEKGNHVITFSFSGYRPVQQTLAIADQPITLHINMKEEITELKAVVITAGAFEASDTRRASALNPIDIVTTASADGDITNAMKTLPGTQQVGEQEGLFVRGGTADETRYFIDGSLVNKFYFSSEPGQATRGRFNPFLFKGTVFSTGGYSALYGQALSSVLIMESIDLPERTSADFGISLLSANAGIQKLSKNKKSSWGATYSYANLALAFAVSKQRFDYFKIPAIHQGDYNFRIKTSRTGMLKYYGSIGNTDVGFRNQDVDSLSLKDAFGLKNFNWYHNLSWRERWGDGWKLQAGASYTNNRDRISMELQDQANQKQTINSDPLYAAKNFKLDSKGMFANGKVVLEKRLAGLSAVRFGAEYNHSREKAKYHAPTGGDYLQTITENILSGFAETDIYVTNDLAAKLGVRTEHSALIDKWNVAPRVSLAYKLGTNSHASLAYGLFYQTPAMQYFPAQAALHFARSAHYIAQYQLINKDYTFRTEVFYKKYDDLLKTAGSTGRFAAINNDGFGDAKGIEFFWRDKKTFTNFDYWISYSYLDTKRDFLQYPKALEPDFASRHTASLVIKKFVLPVKTQFNASYTFATGRPYYNMVEQGNGDYLIKEQGHARPYNNLSLSVNYLPSIGKQNARAFTVFVLSVSNVLGAENIYTYRFSADGNNKVAVTPPSRRFVFLGCFISIGIDRTQDAINNNL